MKAIVIFLREQCQVELAKIITHTPTNRNLKLVFEVLHEALYYYVCHPL